MVPKGTHTTGPLRLKSRVNLFLEHVKDISFSNVSINEMISNKTITQ